MLSWIRARLRPAPPPRVPAGTRVYAIGDVHGRADLLERLLAAIERDAASAPPRRVLVFLGDYVDRGHQSREVLERLTGEPFEGYETVFLAGNHDAWLRDALGAGEGVPEWLEAGGLATLLSYGVEPPRGAGREESGRLAERLREAVPASHQAFLAGLARYHVEGDYLFVHAGVRPGVALEEQRDEDLLWIREEFLEDPSDHGRCVVHGHSVRDRPEVRRNRIGIDTGAFATGRLSCLVLEEAGRRFLET